MKLERTFATHRSRDLELKIDREREREREEFPLFPSFLRNAEVAESWDSIVLSMNVDKTPIDNKVKRVECDSPLSPRSPSLGSPAKLGQVLTSKQSDPAIKRWKTGGKACKGKIRGRSPVSVVLFFILVILDGIGAFASIFFLLLKKTFSNPWFGND